MTTPRTRKARLTEVGELQLQLLDLLDQLGEATVYQLLDQFPRRTRPHYNTVMSALRRLEKRELVEHRSGERQFHFSATPQGVRVRLNLLEQVLNRVFGGSRKRLVSALLQTDEVTRETLEELRELIECKGEEIDESAT